MRRALILTNEAARHPFRASLPPTVNFCPRRLRLVPPPAPLRRARHLDDAARTFCACFLAVSAFLF